MIVKVRMHSESLCALRSLTVYILECAELSTLGVIVAAGYPWDVPRLV